MQKTTKINPNKNRYDLSLLEALLALVKIFEIFYRIVRCYED